MDLPIVVRSNATFDTQPGRDLRRDEEAIVLEAEDVVTAGVPWSRWRFLTLDNPRIVEVSFKASADRVLHRWLVPVA